MLGGLPAYVCRPAAPATRAVILATDVFGFALPNTRRLADQFASRGFLAVVPDLLDGDALPLDAFNKGFTPAVADWLARHDKPEHVQGKLAAVSAELRARLGATKVGVIGYCWGGKFAVLAAATPVVHAFAAAHPSRLAIPDAVNAAIAPGQFLLAGTDNHITGEVEEALRAAASAATARGVEIGVRKWPGTTHGFAVRGSDDDPVVASARLEAFAAAADFFDRVLA